MLFLNLKLDVKKSQKGMEWKFYIPLNQRFLQKKYVVKAIIFFPNRKIMFVPTHISFSTFPR